MSTKTTTSKIRICTDCKRAPAKGIRSKRCLECHKKHQRAKTRKWNQLRSEKARAEWSSICEYEGCDKSKYNTRFATKYCEHHRDVAKDKATKEWRERRKQHRIENPGPCENPGCTRNAYSYKSKYCTPCRAEVRRAQNAIYRQDRSVEHNEKNIQVLRYVQEQLQTLVNESTGAPDKLDTMAVHRLGTIMLQIRAWNYR
jgi:hypothetical protein